VNGANGLALVDEDGNRVRDLIGVPMCRARLGEPFQP